jgi:hypothetical protein
VNVININSNFFMCTVYLRKFMQKEVVVAKDDTFEKITAAFNKN